MRVRVLHYFDVSRHRGSIDNIDPVLC